MTEEEKTIQEKLLTSIKEGKLKMRPKWHFVLKGILLALVGVILVALLLYLGSFVIYANFPFIPILAAIVVALLLERVLNNYAPAYRWPIAYTFGILVFFALLGSFSLHRAHLHERIHRYVHEQEVPIFNPFYNRFGPPPPPPLEFRIMMR